MGFEQGFMGLAMGEPSLVSDGTEREAGTSQAWLHPLPSHGPGALVFLALLNPQSSGACFAGVHWQLEPQLVGSLQLSLELESLNKVVSIYQVVLVTEYSKQHHFAYVSNISLEKEQRVRVSSSDLAFEPRYRGRLAQQPALGAQDKICRVGLQIVGRASQDNAKWQKGLYGLAINKLELGCA